MGTASSPRRPAGHRLMAARPSPRATFRLPATLQPLQNGARVYFGQQETSYAIVGTHLPELDYPNESTGGQHNTTYTGGGGVPIGSPLNRLLYAIKYRQLNILLSGAIDGN